MWLGKAKDAYDSLNCTLSTCSSPWGEEDNVEGYSLSPESMREAEYCWSEGGEVESRMDDSLLNATIKTTGIGLVIDFTWENVIFNRLYGMSLVVYESTYLGNRV